MAIQIANPAVVRKITRLAEVTGLSKTAAVEMAVDRVLQDAGSSTVRARMASLLAQMDRIPDIAGSTDPLEWDEHGLPR